MPFSSELSDEKEINFYPDEVIAISEFSDTPADPSSNELSHTAGVPEHKCHREPGRKHNLVMPLGHRRLGMNLFIHSFLFVYSFSHSVFHLTGIYKAPLCARHS